MAIKFSAKAQPKTPTAAAEKPAPAKAAAPRKRPEPVSGDADLFKSGTAAPRKGRKK